jgi:hypothetical protein
MCAPPEKAISQFSLRSNSQARNREVYEISSFLQRGYRRELALLRKIRFQPLQIIRRFQFSSVNLISSVTAPAVISSSGFASVSWTM